MEEGKLLHADDIDKVQVEQIALSERAISGESYLANMGVCPECISTVAEAWVEANKNGARQDVVNAMQEGYDLEEASIMAVDSMMAAAYVRGFTVGLMMGRHKE